MSARFDHRKSNHFVATNSSGYEGGGDMTTRAIDAATGSEALEQAIDDLVRRTAKRLPIPAEWKHKPLSFARAYLGMRP